MTKNQHIHKLKRLKYKSGNTIFFCSLPDCNFKINIALTLGKRSICWRCGESFIMSEYSLRLAKPHCEKCHKPKNPKETIESFNAGNVPEGEMGEFTISEVDAVNKEITIVPSMSLAERLTRAIHQVAVPEEDEL